MILVDTDHINVLQSEGVPANLLNARMAASVDQEFTVAAVTIEEQLRGWLALIHRSNDVEKQIPAYERLVSLFDFFERWQIISFDLDVAREFKRLRGLGVRVATMDLKIAATALVHGALLLSANLRDFRQVPGLMVEDWLHV